MQTSFGLRVLRALADYLTTAATDPVSNQAWRGAISRGYGPQLLAEADLQQVQQLLHNALLSEHSLRLDVDLFERRCVPDYELARLVSAGVRGMRHAAQAVLWTLGTHVHTEALLYRELGRLVVKNCYPRWAGFYASGPFRQVAVHRLELAHYPPHLHIAGELVGQQLVLEKGLRWSRALIAQRQRRRVQANPLTALRNAHTGKVLERWGRREWDQLTWRLGYTSVFDLVREVGNHGYDYQDLDGDRQQEFVRQLLRVVQQLNRLNGQVLEQLLSAEQFAQLPFFMELTPSFDQQLSQAA